MSEQHYTSNDDQVQSLSKAQRANFDEQQTIIKTLFDHSPLMMGVAELRGDTIIGVLGNPAVAQLLSRSPDDIPQRTGEELGNPPEENQIWLEHYRRCQQEGKQVKFEYQRPHRSPRQWLSATVNFIGMGSDNQPRFSFYVEDITERKRAEEALSQSEERQAFLLKLSDLLRPLSDPLAIEETIARTAMDYFQADRCYYCVIEGDQSTISRDAARGNLPSVAGVYPLNAMPIFKAVVETGRPFVVQDARTADGLDENLRQLCIDLQVISFVDVPVIKDGLPVGILCLVQSMPREWTDLEVDLAVEIAERAWAAVERARAADALRASEERYRALTTASSDVVYRMSPDWSEMYQLQGRNFIQDTETPSRTWLDTYIDPMDQPRVLNAIRTRSVFALEHQVVRVDGSLGWTFSRAVPILDARGEIVEWIGAASDITEHKQAEDRWKNAAERDAYLVKLSDALRPLADPLEIQAAATQILGEHLGVTRAVYIEIDGDEYVIGRDYVNGVPSMAGRYPVSSFGAGKLADYRAGKTRVVRDTRDDIHNSPSDQTNFTAINVSAGIGVPLVKDGAFVANLAVHMNEPRNWTPEEVALVEETAERTWAAVERARAEEALRASEQKYRQLFENMDEGVAICDLVRDAHGQVIDYRFIELNGAFEHHMHLDRSQVIGRLRNEVLPEDQAAVAMYADAVAAKKPFRGEYYSNALEQWYDIGILPQDGDRFVVLFNNITERKWHDLALQESEERFRTSIESLPEAFVIYSAVRQDGKIVDLRYEYVNDLACQFHQLPREQMLGRTILEIAPAAKDTGFFDQYVQVIETGQPVSGQRYLPNKEGDKSRAQGVYNYRVSKFRDGMIITANDVTEQVRLEAEHQKAVREREIHHRLTEQRELERQSIARDIHDGPVQTLSSLLFNLQMLREASADPAFQLEVDNVKLNIKSTVQELRQIMYELRPPSVIQFGLSKAIQAYTENLREHHSRITWNLNLADDGQLLSQQVCLTLFRIYQEAVNNTIRHAEARQSWVRIEVLPEQVVLEIRDDGKGFVRKQDMAHLTERKHFGLAGIAERVEAIHGAWEIKTRPGDGTIITVKVPIIRE